MDIALSTITFHTLTLDEALDGVVEAGFDSIDLGAVPLFCPHVDLDDPSEQQQDRARRAVRDRGLRVASVNTVPSVGLKPDELGSARELDRARVALAIARSVDAGLLTINAWSRSAGQRGPLLEAWAAHIRRVIDEAGGMDVQLEIPHHGTMAESVSEAVELLEAVRAPGVRVTYDTSHIVAGGSTISDSLQHLGPHIGHVHLRDAIGSDINHTPGDGEVDFAALLSYLQDRPVSMSFELEYGQRHASMSVEELAEEARRARRHIESLGAAL